MNIFLCDEKNIIIMRNILKIVLTQIEKKY